MRRSCRLPFALEAHTRADVMLECIGCHRSVQIEGVPGRPDGPSTGTRFARATGFGETSEELNEHSAYGLVLCAVGRAIPVLLSLGWASWIEQFTALYLALRLTRTWRLCDLWSCRSELRDDTPSGVSCAICTVSLATDRSRDLHQTG